MRPPFFVAFQHRLPLPRHRYCAGEGGASILRRWWDYFAEDIRLNPLRYSLLALVMLCGLFFGLASPTQLTEEAAERCRDYVGNYLELLPAADLDYFHEFSRAFMVNGALLAVILLFGLHLLGLPFIAAVLFYKCFTLGFAIGFLLEYQSLSAFLIILAAILPQNVLMLPLMLRAAGAACQMSQLLRREHSLFAREKRRLLSSYTIFALAALGLALMAALWQGYISPLVLQIFYYI